MDNKLAPFLKARAQRWEYLAARDAYLSQIFDKVIKDNNLANHMWNVTPGDLANGSTDTLTVIKWKKYYPFVIGDEYYNKKKEEDYAQINNSIFVMVHGTTIGDFLGNVHFDHNSLDGHISKDIAVPQKKFASTNLKAPNWFETTLAEIIQWNKEMNKIEKH